MIDVLSILCYRLDVHVFFCWSSRMCLWYCYYHQDGMSQGIVNIIFIVLKFTLDLNTCNYERLKQSIFSKAYLVESILNDIV